MPYFKRESFGTPEGYKLLTNCTYLMNSSVEVDDFYAYYLKFTIKHMAMVSSKQASCLQICITAQPPADVHISLIVQMEFLNFLVSFTCKMGAQNLKQKFFFVEILTAFQQYNNNVYRWKNFYGLYTEISVTTAKWRKNNYISGVGINRNFFRSKVLQKHKFHFYVGRNSIQ